MIVLLRYIAIGLILFFGFSQTVNWQIQNKEKNQVVGMNNYKWERDSPYSVKETADRLLVILKNYPAVVIISRINQQENAKLQGVEIDDLETLLFQNNALVGAIFSANPEAAFSLPIKATIWKDKTDIVRIRVTDIEQLDKIYGLNGAIEIICDLLPPWLDILVSDKSIEQITDGLPQVDKSKLRIHNKQ